MSIFAPLMISLAAATSARTAADAPPIALVEAAPLRGLLGQLAVRAEVPVFTKFAVGGEYEQYSTASERANVHDTHLGVSAEVLFYPLGFKDFPVFVGAGVRRERVAIGRQRLRDTNSWARTNGDEIYDHWTNDDTYLSATQAIGYRLLRLGFATASLRLVRDELIHTSTSVAADDVKSYEPDLASPGRKTVVSSLLLHAGVYLP